MDNPFLRRSDRKIGTAGRVAEKKAAKKLGGRLTPASGASGKKGDIYIQRFMVECKSTQAESMGVQKEWLDKVRREALAAGQLPALLLQFIQPNGTIKDNGDWVCIPQSAFRDLILHLSAAEEE